MTNPTRSGIDRSAKYDPGSAAPAPAPEGASLVEDFMEIFYAPSRVFARRASGAYWAPLVAISLLAALFAFANRSVTAAVFDAEFSRTSARAMAANPRLTQEMMSQQRGIAEGFASVAYYVGMPLLILFVAVLVWMAAKTVSAKIDWRAAMLVATLAQIPRLVGALLTTVQALLMDTSTITSMHSVGYSPARFMDPDATPKQLMDLVGRFDVFTLWVTVLLAIGIAVVGKVPRSKGAAGAAIVWGVATALTVVSLLWS